MGVRVARTRGAKRRLVLEAQYWELILAGVGPVEAAKRVGIGCKTGYRWRHENGGLPPSRISDEVRSDRYLSLLERQRIATLRERGLSIREVARRLSAVPLQRSAAMYAATPSVTTAAATTPISPTPGPPTVLAVAALAGC
ncbi:helix-turn-helix domain-containing protein [Nocardia rhamnosiphila]